MTIMPMPRRQSRWSWRGFALRWTVILVLLVLFVAFMTVMPGKSYKSALPALTADESEIKANLQRHVSTLAGETGPRNTIQFNALVKASQYIEDSLKAMGYTVSSQEYSVDGRNVRNLIAEIHGAARASEIVVVGAHYDTVMDSPGADDNASGVAGLLEIARILKTSQPARTLRFVAFVNEEPPYFQTANMVAGYLRSRRASSTRTSWPRSRLRPSACTLIRREASIIRRGSASSIRRRGTSLDLWAIPPLDRWCARWSGHSARQLDFHRKELPRRHGSQASAGQTSGRSGKKDIRE